MTAKPTTKITARDRAQIAESIERLIETEAKRLQSQGHYPQGYKGLGDARLEVAVTIAGMDVVEHTVAQARSRGATWDDIAKAVGLASRGSAARRFLEVRPAESVSPARAENRRLNRARRAKNDDFRTRIGDVESQLETYPDAFRDLKVLLPCDDLGSAFGRYFDQNFDRLGLASLTATSFVEAGSPDRAKMSVRTRDGARTTAIEGGGDFRSATMQTLIAGADVIVTNPPFSLFGELVTTLVEHGKKFLILGGVTSVTTKAIWALIRQGRVWVGASAHNGVMQFEVPNSYHGNVQFGADGSRWAGVAVRWYTNLDVARQHVPLPLTAKYDPARYPVYDNYPGAIEVSKLADIPADYEGEMGVPVTFVARHDPEQFEIVGLSRELVPETSFLLDGRALYERIVIRKRVS